MTVSLAALVHVYGDTVFLEGPQKEAVNLEKLIFTATKDDMRGQRFIRCKEEDELIGFIRSLRSLEVLCLNYTPQPKVAEVYDPFDLGGNQKSLRDEFPSGSSPGPQQESDVYCTFPLKRALLPSVEYSRQSIALTQQQWKLSKADLVFVAKACPYAMDLAIPCRELEKIVWSQGQITPELQQQVESIVDTLNKIHLLEYLQWVKNSREHWHREDIVESCNVKAMTRVVLETLSAKGLRLDLFTVVLRDTVYPYDVGPDQWHLRVHEDTKKPTIFSAKAQGTIWSVLETSATVIFLVFLRRRRD